MSLKLKFLGFISLIAFLVVSIFLFVFRSYHKLPSCDSDFVKARLLSDVGTNFEAINKVLEPVNNSYELVGISDFKDIKSSILGNVKNCSASVAYKVTINNKNDKKQFDSSSFINFSVEYKSFSDRKNNNPTILLFDGKKDSVK